MQVETEPLPQIRHGMADRQMSLQLVTKRIANTVCKLLQHIVLHAQQPLMELTSIYNDSYALDGRSSLRAHRKKII